MQQLSFPFSNKCYFSICEGNRSYAPVEAEEAVTAAEIYQSLNYRSQHQFRKPMVLHFPGVDQQSAVWFGYSFDVEVILVDATGTISKTFVMPKRREGDALFVQFFIDCAYVLLVPVGFCKNGISVNSNMELSLHRLPFCKNKRSVNTFTAV